MLAYGGKSLYGCFLFFFLSSEYKHLNVKTKKGEEWRQQALDSSTGLIYVRYIYTKALRNSRELRHSGHI